MEIMNGNNRTYALPGNTSASVVIGLQCQTSQKWKLFLQDGPYWNYIANFVAKKRFFHGKDTRIDDVVSVTIARVARCFASGRFVYKAAGQGYFRAFLKMVATHVALDVLRKENRYSLKTCANDTSFSCDEKDVLAADAEDSASDTRKLDEYDSSSDVRSESGSGSRRQSFAHLVSMDDIKGLFPDGDAGTFDPASMQRYEQECTREEQTFLKRVQKNVFNLALVSVLSDESVPVARRELLNMLYVGRMSPGEIYALEDYKSLRRGTFDKKVFDARQALVKPILEFWKACAPEFCADSEEQLRKLWNALLVKPKTRGFAKASLKRLGKSGDAPEGMKNQ